MLREMIAQVNKQTYFDLSPDGWVDNSVDDDPPHALEFQGLASGLIPQQIAYAGEH